MARFELIFAVDDLPEDTVWVIYEHHEAVVASHGGTTLLTMISDGPTAFQAVRRAVMQLEGIPGVRVHRLCEDLVSKVDIAERCGATPQAVGQWARGVRLRSNPFPSPFSLVCGGVWLWGEVNTWLRRAGKKSDTIDSPCRADYAEINQWLNERAAQHGLIPLFDQGWKNSATVSHVKLQRDQHRSGSVDWSSPPFHSTEPAS